MSSSFSSLKTKENLIKGRQSCLILLIGIFYVLGTLFLFIGSEEFYKINTLIIRQCQVKSIDLKYMRNSYFPRWNITVIDSHEITDDLLLASIGMKSDRLAGIKARKYQINETYPCYRSRNENFIIQWNWQWNKPSKLKSFSFLFFGMILVLLATILIIFKRRYQAQLKNTQQKEEQLQLETPLRIKEQQQTKASS